MPPLPSIPRIPATTAARLTIWTYGFFAVMAGALVTAGGYQRWSLATYSTLREVPGGPYTLGPILIVAGLLSLAGSFGRWFYIKGVGILLISVWCFLVAGAVATSAFFNPMVGTLGPPTFLCMAITTAVLIVIDERRRV